MASIARPATDLMSQREENKAAGIVWSCFTLWIAKCSLYEPPWHGTRNILGSRRCEPI
jgi:hypothetical protein